MADLKPCPFCGAPDPEHGGNFVQCGECDGQSFADDSPHRSEGTEAARRWNMRAALPAEQQGEVNAALEAIATIIDRTAGQVRRMAIPSPSCSTEKEKS